MDTIVLKITGNSSRESADWVQKLVHMYTQFCRLKNIPVQTEYKDGCGVVIIENRGFDLIKEYLTGEHGIHRFVYLSPYDPENRRVTTFVSVNVSFIENNEMHLVRSYFMHPEKRVKDVKTGMILPDTDLVLNSGMIGLFKFNIQKDRERYD